MKNKIPDGLLVKFLRTTAMIGGIFSLVLTVLIVVTYLQLKRADPLNTPALTRLQQQLQSDPANETLKQEIRDLDLLARKAFFTSQWQVRTGGYLLAAFLLLGLLSMKALEMITPVNPETPGGIPPDALKTRNARRQWFLAAGILLVAVVFVMAWFNHGQLAGSLAAGVDSAEPGAAGNNPGNTGKNTVLPGTPAVADSTSRPADTASAAGMAWTPPSEGELRANFPCFRGPGGLGIAWQKNLPVAWDGSSGKNIRWKTAIPLPGYNSPIVWKDKVFLSGASGAKRAVFCFRAADGKIAWTAEIPKLPGSPEQNPKVNSETGLAAPTLTTDGHQVYAIFANGDLAAIDFDGKTVWTKSLGSPRNHYGHSSSLILYRDLLIVQYDQTGAAAVIALSVKNGDKVWETSRNVKVSWASPILVNNGGKAELILAAEPCVIAYDPANGKERWRMDCISGEVGPSPAFAAGMVFSVNEYSKLAAIRTSPTPSVAWEDDEYLSDVPSPVASGGMLFLVTSYGVVVCYDAATGQKNWVKELERSVYASPMIADGKLYVLDKQGLMHIFSAEKTMTPLGDSPLGEGSVCTPAFADGRIFIRGNSNLYCIGNR